MQHLSLDFEVDFNLIGIHSPEEDYRLAYLLNQHLSTKFSRYKFNLDFENSNAEFPLFEYIDDTNYINYYLINNKHIEYNSIDSNVGLFGGNFSSTSYLIQEKKNIDFFLKIEGCCQPKLIQQMIENLNAIDQIVTSYSIDPNNLKTKDYLIF